MKNYSVNLVRQFYVDLYGKPGVTAHPEVKKGMDGSFVIEVPGYGEKGNAIHTDIIDPKKVDSISFVHYKYLSVPTAGVKINLKEEDILTGETYMVNLNISGLLTMGDEDIFQKFCVYKAKAGDTADNVIKGLVKSAQENLSRNLDGTLFEYKLIASNGTTEVATSDSGSGYKGFVIRLVVDANTYHYNQVMRITAACVPVEDTHHNEIVWAEAKDASKSVVPTHNGFIIAAMEKFFLGYRGDQYRGMGYPDVIDSKYEVNPDANYNIVDIQYHFSGDNEDSLKSAKTITIVGTDATEIEDIANDVSAASGVKYKYYNWSTENSHVKAWELKAGS